MNWDLTWLLREQAASESLFDIVLAAKPLTERLEFRGRKVTFWRTKKKMLVLTFLSEN